MGRVCTAGDAAGARRSPPGQRRPRAPRCGRCTRLPRRRSRRRRRRRRPCVEVRPRRRIRLRRRARRHRWSTARRARRRPPEWVRGGFGFVNVVLADDGDLAGQLGDCDGVGVATTPPAPTAYGRGADCAVLRQQLRDRDRSRAAVAVFWSCHRVLPLGLATSRPASAHGRLHQGRSIRFAVEFPQNQPFSQCPGADVHAFDGESLHARLSYQSSRHDLWRPLGTHPFQLRTVSRGHPRDECYELPKAGSCECPLDPRSRPRGGCAGEPGQRSERLRRCHREVRDCRP